MKAVFCAKNKIVKTGISCHSKISDVAESDESREHCYSLCLSLEYFMTVKLTEHNLEFLSLKGGCRGFSESTHLKMHKNAYCWRAHAHRIHVC